MDTVSGSAGETRAADAADSAKASKVAFAGLIGTSIEWYDFFIYGTAAGLVFAPQFFPSVSPTVGTLAAFSTFAVGFVARPIGAAVMGHVGDRIGRKRILLLSVLMMGLATFAIGLLPTYATIGIAAPLILVVLRFLQGFAVGGEWGGAVLMSLEHAPPNRRTLYAAFPQIGLPIGIFLSSGVFLIVRLLTSAEAFADWAWRIPFLLSVVLVGVGLFIRVRIGESPEFAEVKERGEVRKMPLVDVVRRHPGSLLLATGVNIGCSGLGNILLVFSVSYVALKKLASPSAMLAIVVITSVAWAAAVYAGASLAERVGRKRVVMTASAIWVVWAFVFYALIDTGSVVLIGVSCVVLGILIGVGNGPVPALVAEAFPAAVRFSGASVTYGLGGIFGGAFAPIIATALYGGFTTSIPLSIYAAVLALFTLVSAALIRSLRADSPAGSV
ncbi:MFS transporter [Pseudonocardia halophobica]|uniref:Putative proline/betaine transporter n=1 Tax=Pseudonocardia halophobica TaxID=29401 RepID=A0A9W6NZ53_9PSEU|nr:MFS transporter [Pseudonocardia halophobica]GLL14488.1 MFS transporter [Pseudonocardia halophobica]